MASYVPDTRPYPLTLSKNELLLYADILSKNPADRHSSEMLAAATERLLASGQHQTLAVALALVPSWAHYRLIWQTLDRVLSSPRRPWQFVVLPLVAVLGTKTATAMTLDFDPLAWQHIFQKIYPQSKEQPVTWLEKIIPMRRFAALNAGDWYMGAAAPQDLGARLLAVSPATLNLAPGHRVELGYVIGYRNAAGGQLWGQKRDHLPLAQFWNQILTARKIVPFVNPLALTTPVLGLAEGAKMQKMMAFNIFVTDSIRAVRLTGGQAAAVIAARPGGVIEFNIENLLAGGRIYSYRWQLSPWDDEEELEAEWVSLFLDCRVEAVRLLREAWSAPKPLPRYQEAVKLAGKTPTAV